MRRGRSRNKSKKETFKQKSTFLTTIKVIPNHNRRDDFYCGCQNHFQIYSSQQKFLKLNADKSEQICNYAHNKKEEKVLLISGVITLEDLIDTSNVDFRSEKKSLFQTQNCKVM